MYKYQLHTHSSPASHCSKTSPEDFAHAILKGGYTGCVLTNHFLHGNTGIESFISWKAFAEEYREDYYRMKAVGDKIGIDVLFGVYSLTDGKVYPLFFQFIVKLAEIYPAVFFHGNVCRHSDTD